MLRTLWALFYLHKDFHSNLFAVYLIYIGGIYLHKATPKHLRSNTLPDFVYANGEYECVMSRSVLFTMRRSQTICVRGVCGACAIVAKQRAHRQSMAEKKPQHKRGRVYMKIHTNMVCVCVWRESARTFVCVSLCVCVLWKAFDVLAVAILYSDHIDMR